MSQETHIAATVHLVFALACVWVLIFVCWRTYRVDALRQRLFELRDELFDYATSGAIAYDDPAYWRLRLVINGMIRFAHRLNFPLFLLTAAVNSLRPHPCPTNPFQEWLKSVEEISNPETRMKLHEFNSRMGDALIRHIITGSPTCVIMLVLFAIGAFASSAVWPFLKKTGATSLQILEAEAARAQAYRDSKKAYA